MVCGRWIGGLAVGMASLALAGTLLRAQTPQSQPPASGRSGRELLPQPVYRVAQQTPDPAAVANNTSGAGVQAPAQAAAQQHPLVPALEMAYASMANIEKNVKDYSCTMFKRERIGDKLLDQECMFLKVRHEPFSVYMYFLGPANLKGQEVLYVHGKNNNNLIGRGVGIQKLAGAVPLQPTGAMAMRGQRYPITEIGFLNLTKRLVEVAEMDKNYGECDVQFFKNAKINIGNATRQVTCIQVVHPVPRKNFRFHMARVFVDDQLNIPIRYESHDWPATQGGKPLLLEEYTYTDIKLNNGFTDRDFDEHNPEYRFH